MSSLPGAAGKVRAWAAAVVDDGQAVVLDTETTTLYGRVLQVGVVDLAGAVLMDQLVNPTEAIAPAAQAVHHIGAADVTDAPSFGEIAANLSANVGGRTVLAYHALYDQSVLATEYARAGLVMPQSRWECLLAARTKVVGRRLRLNGPHHAIGDCFAALSVLYSLAGQALPDAVAAGLQRAGSAEVRSPALRS